MDAQNQQRHQQRQQKIKQQVDKRIADATESRGLLIVFTGNGKGKSTAAFGTVTRAVGHGQRAGAIQFIKGDWPCGERDLLAKCGVEFQVMSTGFTWETQNKETDRQAALAVWQHAKRMLSDDALDVVVLDELTYIVAYDYIDLDEVIDAVHRRPAEQTVIITGRGCHRALLDMADTVTEMRPIKHAFDNGVAARRGVDW